MYAHANDDLVYLHMYYYVHVKYLDFTELKGYYHTILQLMPDDYEPTVAKLQDYISDEQICAILSSSNSTVANNIILDCLIERMSCREELFDLCDQLEKITSSNNMRMVTNEIRLGQYYCQKAVLLLCSCTYFCMYCIVMMFY